MKETNTDQLDPLPGDKMLKNYETGMTILLVGLACFHIMISAFRNSIIWWPLKAYEYTTAGVLVFAGLFYLLISCIFYKWNLKRIRSFFRRMTSYEQIFLLVFTVWFGLSYLINKTLPRPGFSRMNDWYTFDVFINAAVLFPLAKILRTNRIQKLINVLLLLLMISYSAFTAYGLWQVFYRRIIRLPNGSLICMSEPPDYGLKLGSHYNITGAMAFLMIFICLYFLTGTKKKWRMLLLPLFFMHLFAAQLSNSRTIFVTGLLTIPLFLFFHHIRGGKDHPDRKRLLSALLIAGISFAFYWFSRPLTFQLFENVSHYKEIVYKEFVDYVDNKEDVTDQYSSSVRQLTNIHGREIIWKCCLKVLTHDPLTFLFGVTPTSIPNALVEPGGLHYNCPHAHNMVLQVGMSAGVPPMLAYCVFLIFLCVRCIRVLFTRAQISLKAAYRVPFFILSLAMPCLMEYYIVSYFVMAGLFSLFAGWVLVLDNEIKQHSV